MAEGWVRPRQSKRQTEQSRFRHVRADGGPTVGVEEGERVADGNGSTQEPGGDQALPLPLADDADNAEMLQILIQSILQHL